MSTTTTHKLTGRRFTAEAGWDMPRLAVGDIVFCEDVTYGAGERPRPRECYELSAMPGRRNLSGEIAPLGAWLGSTCGRSAQQLGRVEVVAVLRRNDECEGRRYSVRKLEEGSDEFMEAANAAVKAWYARFNA